MSRRRRAGHRAQGGAGTSTSFLRPERTWAPRSESLPLSFQAEPPIQRGRGWNQDRRWTGSPVRTDTTVRRLLSVGEVADVLGVPVRTLYQWRHKGVGPVGLRVGRHLRYRAADVSEWIDRRAAEEANSRRG